MAAENNCVLCDQPLEAIEAVQVTLGIPNLIKSSQLQADGKHIHL